MTIHYLEPEPLNGTDAALWDIERNPTLRTTIVSLLTLDRPIDPERLIAAARRRVAFGPATPTAHREPPPRDGRAALGAHRRLRHP